MLDLRIQGGTVVDGSGRSGYVGDVGIRDGRIVAVGTVEEPAREAIDVAGRIVAPGFIDAHTHYDAQAFWEPTLSPSCYHGVTTVVGGFCGFSIAPLTLASASYIKPMLARVEGMPQETLETAVPWNWSTFGEFLGQLDGKIGLNAGFFAGHSAIRRIVMAERAVGEKASAEDLAAMKRLLGQSLAEGALGFSTTVSPTHNDGDGNPVPSRWADYSEIIELAKVVREHEGTGLELLPDVDFGPGIPELIADFSLAGNRPVNWNVMAITGRPDAEQIAERQLAVSTLARERGAEVIALTLPSVPQIYMTLRTGFNFDSLPGIWREIFKLPITQRITQFSDPTIRKRLGEDAASMLGSGSVSEFMARLEDYKVVSVIAPENTAYVGRRLGEIAEETDASPIDTMLSIAIADKLETVFSPAIGGDDHASYALRGRLWQDDRTLVGASDAGAHLDVIDSFAFSTDFLEKGVREHKVISLEEAIHQITERPARYFGLIDRGRIALGYHADIVVFDADTIGKGPTYQRYDLPGGNDFRLYADAKGIEHVFVNGVEIVRAGRHSGKRPGTVLRSGRDTRTVPMDALRT